VSDPRFDPGGRFHYGSKEDQVAELAAAGVTSNGDGPIVKGRTAKGKLKTQPCLTGMVEKVRQRAGYQLADWKSAGSRTLKRPSPCAICGATIHIGERYHRGSGHRAHWSCVKAWREVGDGREEERET
jgi:hypothetical protein